MISFTRRSHLVRRCSFSFVMLLVVVAACQPPAAGAGDGDDGPMLRTAMDTIQFGRGLIIQHACGDCHGGGDNPSAPVWLMGAPPNDTIFEFKIPTPDGIFITRPRNLTPDNETGTGRFTERQIFNALRYGLRPGETPDVEITSTTPGQGNFPAVPKYLASPMPWTSFRHMSDRELWSIAAYLKRGLKPQTNRVEPSEGPPDFWAGFYSLFYGPPQVVAFPTERELGAPPQ